MPNHRRIIAEFPSRRRVHRGTLVLVACAERSTAPDSAEPTGAYKIARSDLIPPEREPDFDIVGAVWEIIRAEPDESEPFTIDVPVPDELPSGVTPQQLVIVGYEPGAPGDSPFWLLASDVTLDEQRGVLTTQSSGSGLFAAAIPLDYWTVAASSGGSYEIYYVSDSDVPEGAAPTLIADLQAELEAARAWLLGEGYPDPVDALGQSQRVFLAPLRGGRGLVRSSNLGTVLLLSNRLDRVPDALRGVVTHELFHLSQQQALLDTAADQTWIREASAEYVAVQRLGIEGGRPHVDSSCENYKRTITDTRGINEYHNWTFVAYMEDRQPGFVQRLLQLPQDADVVDQLGMLAGVPLNELFARYALSYRLLRSYPLAGELSCPAPATIAVGAREQSFQLPPLASLLLVATGPTPQRYVLTIETAGDPYVALWQRSTDGYEPLPAVEPVAPGRIVRQIDCAAAGAPPAAIVLAVGAGETPAEIRVSTRVEGEC
ncbi:MAG: hypothetical protein IH959_02325 [Chloroflexi bacterium]|nr:hypothetical protein [Chloroflexota bacterium]